MIGEDVEASDDVTAGSATGSHYLMCVVEHNADAQDAEHTSTISLVAVNIATGQLSCAVPGGSLVVLSVSVLSTQTCCDTSQATLCTTSSATTSRDWSSRRAFYTSRSASPDSAIPSCLQPIELLLPMQLSPRTERLLTLLRDQGVHA